MPITSVDANQGTSPYQTGEAPRQDRTKLNPDDFVKLFLTQLTHQNPLQPTDSSAILQQMSQVSSIEAANNMQKSMSALADSVHASLANTQLLQATALVGKNVEIQSGVSPLVKNNEGQILNGSVFVPDAASDVTVTIKDPTGKNVVKTIELGKTMSSGLLDFNWDGKDLNGNVMDPGYYQITATATLNGKQEQVGTAGSFKINSVGLDQQGVIFNVDGLGGKHAGDIIKIL